MKARSLYYGSSCFGGKTVKLTKADKERVVQAVSPATQRKHAPRLSWKQERRNNLECTTPRLSFRVSIRVESSGDVTRFRTYA